MQNRKVTKIISFDTVQSLCEKTKIDIEKEISKSKKRIKHSHWRYNRFCRLYGTPKPASNINLKYNIDETGLIKLFLLFTLSQKLSYMARKELKLQLDEIKRENPNKLPVGIQLLIDKFNTIVAGNEYPKSIIIEILLHNLKEYNLLCSDQSLSLGVGE